MRTYFAVTRFARRLADPTYRGSRRRCGVRDLAIVQRSSSTLGILALLLWGVSWSWVVGVGVVVVRVGEVGAAVVAIAAVVIGATAGRRSNNLGLWCGGVVLVLVLALNVLGLALR